MKADTDTGSAITKAEQGIQPGMSSNSERYRVECADVVGARRSGPVPGTPSERDELRACREVAVQSEESVRRRSQEGAKERRLKERACSGRKSKGEVESIGLVREIPCPSFKRTRLDPESANGIVRHPSDSEKTFRPGSGIELACCGLSAFF